MTHLTRERILAIAGDLSGGAVAEIERLGASEADPLAAVGSLGDGPPPLRESGRPLAGPAAALQAILAAEDASREGDEDRRT